MSTPRAPSATARTMSRPLRTPPSSSTSAWGAIADTTSGSLEIVEATPSSWRPPWFDTTTPSAPTSTAARASSPDSTPLMMSLPGQFSRSQAMSFQVTLASNCAAMNALNAFRSLVSVSKNIRLPNTCGRPLSPTFHTQRGCETICQARSRRAASVVPTMP